MTTGCDDHRCSWRIRAEELESELTRRDAELAQTRAELDETRSQLRQLQEQTSVMAYPFRRPRRDGAGGFVL